MESFFFDNGQAFAGFQISLKKKTGEMVTLHDALNENG